MTYLFYKIFDNSSIITFLFFENIKTFITVVKNNLSEMKSRCYSISYKKRHVIIWNLCRAKISKHDISFFTRYL